MGITLALPVIALRLAVKSAATTLFAHLSGITWRKGALTGLAMTPMSGLVIIMLEQTRHLKLYALDQVAGGLGEAAGTADAETERLSTELARTGELRDRISELQQTLRELERGMADLLVLVARATDWSSSCR